MDGKTHRESMREGREKFKNLSLKGKIGYIWDYYKAVIGAVLVAILVIFICIQTMKSSAKETLLSAAVINAEKTNGREALALQEDFGAYCGMDEKTESLSFDDSYIIDLVNGDQVTVACQTKLLASIQAGTMDVMLMPEDIYEHYRDSGAFMKLEEALGKEALEEMPEKLCTGRAEGDEEDFVYALNVTGNEKLKGLFGDREVYLAVTVGTGHLEKIQEFVKYLLS